MDHGVNAPRQTVRWRFLRSILEVTTILTHRDSSRARGGDDPMTWEVPTFVEIKMDAEINSYQEDGPEDL